METGWSFCRSVEALHRDFASTGMFDGGDDVRYQSVQAPRRRREHREKAKRMLSCFMVKTLVFRQS